MSAPGGLPGGGFRAAGHCQGARVRLRLSLSSAGHGHLLWGTLPSGSSWSGHGCEPLTEPSGLMLGNGPSVPTYPSRCWALPVRSPCPPGGLAVGRRCAGGPCWPMLRGPASPRKPPLGPLQPPVVSSLSSETGRCLSRAKASPRAQLSCSKVGSVESCSLSCPAPTHFVPGNPRPSPDGVGGRGSFPGVQPRPCCSPGRRLTWD